MEFYGISNVCLAAVGGTLIPYWCGIAGTMPGFHDSSVETMSRSEIEQLQDEKIGDIVSLAAENTDLYADLYADIDLAGLETVDEFLAALPTIEKDDVRERMIADKDPYGARLAVDEDDLILNFTSTGTSARFTSFDDMPYTSLPMTEHAMDIICDQTRRVLTMTGLEAGDALTSFFFRWSSFGPQSIEATRRHGMTHYPLSGVPDIDMDRNLFVASNFEPDGIFSGLPFATAISERMEDMDREPIDVFEGMNLILAGDVVTKPLKEKFAKEWGVDVYSMGGVGECFVYGSTCDADDGMHFWEDHVVVEVVDPETKKPVEPGERGEIVFTNLNYRAAPIIRWATEDIGVATYEPCECGRTHVRVDFLGRYQYEQTIAGRSIFPSEVEVHLRDDERVGTGSEFQLIKYAATMDELKVRTTFNEERTESQSRLKADLEGSLESALDVPVEVQLVDKITATAHKIPRIDDQT